MNIIILAPTQQQSGGVERFSFYLRDTLRTKGHNVDILSREQLSPWMQKVLRIKKIFGFEQSALGYFLGRIAQRKESDVIITNGMLGWNLFIQKRASQNFSPIKKIINVQHGTFAMSALRIDRHKNIFKYFVKRYIWGFFEMLAARHATICVAVSQETAESVNKFYKTSTVVIQNAVDTNFFAPITSISKKPQVIFVGRFEYAKGQVILEGFKKYLEQQGWRLLIAETLTQDELRIAYNESQVFLLPSLHEGCSYALLEAMACGIPFLASPVGLVSDFTSQGMFNECIVRQQTVDAYVQAFQKLVNLDRDKLETLSQELREYIVRNHSITGAINQYEKILLS